VFYGEKRQMLLQIPFVRISSSCRRRAMAVKRLECYKCADSMGSSYIDNIFTGIDEEAYVYA
jgi:hypothetical protein